MLHSAPEQEAYTQTHTASEEPVTHAHSLYILLFTTLTKEKISQTLFVISTGFMDEYFF